MSQTLSELIKSAQGNDEKAMVDLIKKFNHLVRKYSRMLKYDGSDTDLLITFNRVVKTIQV